MATARGGSTAACRRPTTATARAGPSRRPRPGNRAAPTPGGRPQPSDGGGDHHVERAAGSPQRFPDSPSRPAARGVLRSRNGLRPDAGRPARRRPQPRAGRAGRAAGRQPGQPQYGQQYYGPGEDQYGQTAQGQDYGQAPAGGWARQGHDQYGRPAGPTDTGNRGPSQYGPAAAGQSTGRPGPGQPGQATSEPRQPYGLPPGRASTDRASRARTRPGQTAGTGQDSTGGPAGGRGVRPAPRNTGSWQAAGRRPGSGQSWAGGQGQYAQDPRNTGSWQAAPGQGWAGGHGQPGPGVRHTGSWQAAGPGQGQAWAAGPGQYGPDPRSTGSWQAAGQVRGRRGRQSPGSSVMAGRRARVRAKLGGGSGTVRSGPA